MWYANLARRHPLPLTVFKAFVVAWGGTAAQAGRLTGLLILSLELKKLVERREVLIFWVLLSVLFGKHAENYPPPSEFIFYQDSSSPTMPSPSAPSGTLSLVLTLPMSDILAKCRPTIGYLFVLSQTVGEIHCVVWSHVSNLMGIL